MFVKLINLVLLHKPDAMQSLKLRTLLFYPPFTSNPLQSFIFSFSTVSLSSSKTQYSKETTSLFNFLNSNAKLPKSHSIFISKRASRATFPQRPLSVINFFKQNGFSETQIHSIVRQRVQLLFSDVDKTLKPKLELFRQLGFQGSDLSDFISKHPTVLTASLNKTLVPSVKAIKKIVWNDKELVQVLSKCGWILPKYQLFVANVAFLESFGIGGDQVVILLKRQSRLLVSSLSTIRKYVLQAEELGFNQNSRMFIHGLHTICALSHKTFKKKLDLIQCFGFSKDESLLMFKKAPALFRTSEKKLKIGIEFFLHTVMLPKSILVSRPTILMYSIEDRVFPRYRVFQLLKSQNLCKKGPSFVSMLCYSEDMFLDKFISKFKGNAEALLIAYKGHLLEA
jgi:mTERF domain-containing protein